MDQQFGTFPTSQYGDYRAPNAVAATAFFIVLIITALIALALLGMNATAAAVVVAVIGVIIGFILMSAIRVANQWEKAVVLTMGKFTGLKGPGLFLIVPIFQTITAWIDHRVMVTPFAAEKTLTKDTVPINVDAVLFWHVDDAVKAALEVKDYRQAITWAAQTALRDLIGKIELADILVGRDKMDAELQKIIDDRSNPWGVKVKSVEIRDVIIPLALEEAMSRQAQAERERQARVILGESERQIAESFVKAAQLYHGNATALHLRAMNMLFEGLKERGALMIVPSSAIETMNLGGIAGLAALKETIQPEDSGGAAAKGES